MFGNSWLNTIVLSGMFLVLFAIAELLYHKASFKGETTRKIVHIFTGVFTMLFPLWLENHWQVLILCSSFAIILITSRKLNFLKSINDIDRKSEGSVLFPLVVYLTYVGYTYENQMVFYYLPILTMAICDPIAAIVGMKYPLKQYKIGAAHKSIGGSIGFLLSCVVLTDIGLAFGFGIDIMRAYELILPAAIISVFAMLAEAVSSKGWDNFTIPAVVYGSLYLIKFLTEENFIPCG